MQVGAVFVFGDSHNYWNNGGDLDVYVHDTETEEIEFTYQVTKCATISAGGGIANCNRKGKWVSLYCPTGCKDFLSITMLRVFEDLSIGHIAQHTRVGDQGTHGNSADPWNELSTITKDGSYTGFFSGRPFTISRHTQDIAQFVIDFQAEV